jgi:hypothetical protein
MAWRRRAWRRQAWPARATPLQFCAAMVLLFGVLLAADRFVDLGGQVLLGLGMWIVFLTACRPLQPRLRIQVGLVVVVATSFEVIASLIWGMYTYRLHNIPMFVPPGHGLVYLTGLKLSESKLVREHGRATVGAALTVAVGWTIAGLTIPARPDLVGTIGAGLFVVFLLRGRAPLVYAGVFTAVAALELYGTALGTWRWVGVVPWWHIPQGNPPSGVAGGYVLFDVLAIALTPSIYALVRSAGDRRATRLRTGGLRPRVARGAQSPS